MRRAGAYVLLCAATAACAGVLGIDEVSYSPETTSSGSEAGLDGDTLDAPGDSPGDAGTCTADLTRDPANCGSCAHACGAGVACADGLCAPELVLSGVTTPRGIERVGGVTYVSSSSGVFRCSSVTCGDAGEALLLAASDEFVSSFSADDAGMVVAILTIPPTGLPPGRAVACPLGPCPSPRQLGSAEVNLQTVAKTDQDVLWGQDGVVSSDLLSCPAGQCDGGAVLIGSVAGNATISSIAASGKSVVWMANARIYETTRGGGTQLRASVGTPTGSNQPLARDGADLFWGNDEARIIEGCNLATGCAETRKLISAVPGVPRALVLDGAYVYVAVAATSADAGNAGLLVRTPRASGPKLEPLARPKASPVAMTVDATHVYWAEEDGNVWRVAK